MSWLGLNTSITGMFTSQRKLYTVNHNVNNAEREGYSRQRVNSSANVPLHIPGKGYIGTGIGVDSVERVRDLYLDKKYRTETASFGNWNMIQRSLTEIEGVLRGSDEEGININLDDLFKSIEDLSTNPSDMSYRTAFREKAVTLTKTLNETAKRLYKQQKDLNFEVKTKIKQVNDYVDQIKSLNSEIFAMEVDGTHANDLRDQRDLIVDKLSKLVNIEAEERVVNVEETKDGKSIEIRKFEVRLGGLSLVDHDQASKFKYPPDRKDNPLNPEEPLYQLEWESGGKVELKGGEIKGLLEVRDGGHKIKDTNGKLVDANSLYSGANGIPYYIDKLDEFTRVFADNMNRIHIQGTSLNGTKTIPLFDIPDGSKYGYGEIDISLKDGSIDVSEALKNIARDEQYNTINNNIEEIDKSYTTNGDGDQELVSYRNRRTEEFTYIAVWKDGNLIGRLSDDGTKIYVMDSESPTIPPRDADPSKVAELDLNAKNSSSFSIYKAVRRKVFEDEHLTYTDGSQTGGNEILKSEVMEVVGLNGPKYYEMKKEGENFNIYPNVKNDKQLKQNGWNKITLKILKETNSKGMNFEFNEDSFNATDDGSGNVYVNREFYIDHIAKHIRAEDIKISKEILDDLNNIATIGKYDASGNLIPGDKNDKDDIENSEIFKKMIEVREQSDFFDNSAAYQGRPEDYFTSLLSTLGTDNQQAKRMNTVQELIVKEATNQRLSVSGVNLDEEMADMVKFQQIYMASARMVTTFDQIYDTMINRLGMVGR